MLGCLQEMLRSVWMSQGLGGDLKVNEEVLLFVSTRLVFFL